MLFTISYFGLTAGSVELDPFVIKSDENPLLPSECILSNTREFLASPQVGEGTIETHHKGVQEETICCITASSFGECMDSYAQNEDEE